MTRRAPIALLLAAAATAAACAAFRPGKFEPDERVPAGEAVPTAALDDVHDEMHELAVRTMEVDRLLRDANPAPAERAHIAQVLLEMQTIAGRLDSPRAVNAHPALAAHAADFRSELGAARNGVLAEPPNYYLAGTIAGSCAGCHGPEFQRRR